MMSESSISITVAFVSLGVSFVVLVICLAMTREFGVLLSRFGPDHAMPSTESLPVGSSIDDSLLASASGGTIRSVVSSDARSSMILFMAEQCEACQNLIPAIRVFSSSYAATTKVIVVLRERDSGETPGKVAALDGRVEAIIEDDLLFASLGVLGTPFALLVDPERVVQAKGAPNTLEQLESLFGVREMGLTSDLLVAAGDDLQRQPTQETVK